MLKFHVVCIGQIRVSKLLALTSILTDSKDVYSKDVTYSSFKAAAAHKYQRGESRFHNAIIGNVKISRNLYTTKSFYVWSAFKINNLRYLTINQTPTSIATRFYPFLFFVLSEH